MIELVVTKAQAEYGSMENQRLSQLHPDLYRGQLVATIEVRADLSRDATPEEIVELLGRRFVLKEP